MVTGAVSAGHGVPGRVDMAGIGLIAPVLASGLNRPIAQPAGARHGCGVLEVTERRSADQAAISTNRSWAATLNGTTVEAWFLALL
jgi:hypothetical protein